ncbi:MAG: hypothetical protein E7065_06415 [Lentimicrobiaceae bacterium]|nr:hypothetical protein [Lentimicrobiaceae bacterium]
MNTFDKKELSSRFWRYLSSSILITLSGALGVIVDSIIVGNLIGSDGVSAINLNSTVIQLLMTISLIIASGGGMLAGYAIGRKDFDNARYIFTQSTLGSIIVGVIFAVIGIFFSNQLASILCQNDALYTMVHDYLRVVLFGAPAYMLMWGISTMIIVDGSPRLASVAIIIDNIANLILDVVFIKFFDMGIAGSSLATVVGHLIAVAIMMLHFRNKNRVLHLSFKGGKLSQWRDIISQGAPLAIASICLTLLLFTSNKMVLAAVGREGIFVFSVCMNLLQVYNFFLAGTCRSLQTLGAVLIGERNSDGIRFVFGKSFKFITIAMIITCVYVWIFPSSIATLFGADNADIIKECNYALRIFAISFVPFCYIYFIMIIFKLLSFNRMSLFISLILSLTVIPVISLMAHYAAEYIWYSYLIAYIIEIIAIVTVYKAGRMDIRARMASL